MSSNNEHWQFSIPLIVTWTMALPISPEEGLGCRFSDRSCRATHQWTLTSAIEHFLQSPESVLNDTCLPPSVGQPSRV
ncbi:hypothetical protein XELAEV_18004102mg [Xenopus laevis]|uniref:Uncharacterized protein n=1 Tax=Xenopus laevis TaxID=8355 RepID=A0A974GY19_XENLA|nr:hypothetical protein XELAEV_18004102mg [Xenopus laevis]